LALFPTIIGRIEDTILAKETAIINSFDGPFPAKSRYDTKYFKYLGDTGEASGDILEAFRTADISRIESAIRGLTDSMKTHIFLIGMGCVIIDREALYADAGFHSYLDYAKHLYEATGLSPQSLSAAKIIMERFIDYNPELRKHGFSLKNNSNKLLYLETALENHEDRTEIFKRISNDTFREFQSYARSPDSKESLPEPLPQIKITNGKIIVDGKPYDDLPEKIKQTVERDFSSLYAIRLSGNEPVITSVYDEREARALKKGIETLLKQMRSRR
jgi:hypothetical protein